MTQNHEIVYERILALRTEDAYEPMVLDIGL